MAAQLLAQPKRTRNGPMQPRAGLLQFCRRSRGSNVQRRRCFFVCFRTVSVFRGLGFFSWGGLFLGDMMNVSCAPRCYSNRLTQIQSSRAVEGPTVPGPVEGLGNKDALGFTINRLPSDPQHKPSTALRGQAVLVYRLAGRLGAPSLALLAPGLASGKTLASRSSDTEVLLLWCLFVRVCVCVCVCVCVRARSLSFGRVMDREGLGFRARSLSLSLSLSLCLSVSLCIYTTRCCGLPAYEELNYKPSPHGSTVERQHSWSCDVPMPEGPVIAVLRDRTEPPNLHSHTCNTWDLTDRAPGLPT